MCYIYRYQKYESAPPHQKRGITHARHHASCAGPSEDRTAVPALRQYIQTHIDEALEKGWIRLYYQPVVRALSRTLAGYEALARWQDPVRG